MTQHTPFAWPFAGYLLVTLASALAVYLLRRRRIVNLALLWFTLALCVTSLEAYCRFFYAQSDGFGHLARNFSQRYYHLDAFGLRASNLPLADSKKNLV